MKKSLKEILTNLILFLIVLFTLFSYESLCYLGFNTTNTKNLQFLKNKKNKINTSLKIKCSQNTNIKTTMVKKSALIYQIKLKFTNPMKYTSSFLCAYKVLKIYWDNPFSFNLIIKTKKDINNLVLIINPKQYNLFFETKCNKKLPQEKIIIKTFSEKTKTN